MRRFIAPVLAALLVAGCQSTTPHPASQGPAAFNPAEAAFIRKAGNGTITGHAFLKRSNGGVVNAAGEVVRLVPATAYSRERFARLYGGAKFVAATAMPRITPDPLYASYTRTVKADSRGHFTFDRVAPGTYFVTSQVMWREHGKFLQSGGAMYDVVSIGARDAEPVQVVLSGN